jgi:thioesterase domain-containing protein
MREIFVGIDGTTENWWHNVHFSKFDVEYSYVGMMYTGSFASERNKRWLAGPNLWGNGTVQCVAWALQFLRAQLDECARQNEQPRISLAGYSRGAYACLRVVQALEKAGVPVHFLALLDTVKCTDEGTEDAIGRVIRSFAHIAPPKQEAVHGAGRMADMQRAQRMLAQSAAMGAISREVNHRDCFVVPGNATYVLNLHRDRSVNSRTVPMGHWPVQSGMDRMPDFVFKCTHSAMGGLPFRGDIPNKEVTRLREWQQSGAVGQTLVNHARAQRVIGSYAHPVIGKARPTQQWLDAPEVKSQYALYYGQFGSDGLTPAQDQEIMQRGDTAASRRAAEKYQAASRGRY